MLNRISKKQENKKTPKESPAREQIPYGAGKLPTGQAIKQENKKTIKPASPAAEKPPFHSGFVAPKSSAGRQESGKVILAYDGMKIKV